MRYGVRRVYNAFRRAGVRDVTLHLYPNLRHEIFNEDCRDSIYQDLYQWLEARFPLGQKAQVPS